MVRSDKHLWKRSPGNLNDENVLSLYIGDMVKFSVMSREEEMQTALAARGGDAEAREKMIKTNLRFVINIAKRYRNHGLPLEDLINEGNIGLIEAVNRFDPEKGFQFISYAVWWIKQAILKAINEKGRMIRLPVNRLNDINRILKFKDSFEKEHEKIPSEEEISEALDLKPETVRDLMNQTRDILSLETPVNQPARDDNYTLSYMIKDRLNQTPEEETLQESVKDKVKEVLASLSKKEACILKYRYGLEDERPRSLKEIGKIFHLTKERIRQIERKAISRLEMPSRKNELNLYV